VASFMAETNFVIFVLPQLLMLAFWCRFQLIDILGVLLDRPILKHDFNEHYTEIVQMMDDELNNAKQLYDEHMRSISETGSMPMHKNMSPVAGRLQWVQELRQRISLPMASFSRIEHPYVSQNEINSLFLHLFLYGVERKQQQQ